MHASTGKTHLGEVHSLADSKKRKRHEVVVAVDGEAVNIYNVCMDSTDTALAGILQADSPNLFRSKHPNW